MNTILEDVRNERDEMWEMEDGGTLGWYVCYSVYPSASPVL